MQATMSRSAERRATRMHQMMRRLDVDALTLIRLRSGEAYAEARSRCFRCEDSSLCLLWLDTGRPDAAPEFCPNLEFFNACKSLSQRSFGAARARELVLVKSQGQGLSLGREVAKQTGCSCP